MPYLFRDTLLPILAYGLTKTWVLGRAHDRRLPACQATTLGSSAASPTTRSVRPIPYGHRAYLVSAPRSPPLRVLRTLRRSIPDGRLRFSATCVAARRHLVTDGVLGALHALAHVFRMGADSKRCPLGRHSKVSPYHGFFLGAQGTIQQRRKAPLRRYYVLQLREERTRKPPRR